MSEVKRYYVRNLELRHFEGSGGGFIRIVLAADYDALQEECDTAKEERDLLMLKPNNRLDGYREQSQKILDATLRAERAERELAETKKYHEDYKAEILATFAEVNEVKAAALERERLRGEFICVKCGLRQDAPMSDQKPDF